MVKETAPGTQTPTPAIAFVGALALVGSGIVLFGGRSDMASVRLLAWIAAAALFFTGAILFGYATIKALRTKANRMVVLNVFLLSFVAWGGIVVLSLSADPTPFLSTITAAILSLGIAWGFHVTRESSTNSARSESKAHESFAPAVLHEPEERSNKGDAAADQEE